MSTGLAIVGYGRMGHLIEELAPEYGFDVRAKFTRENNLHDAGINRDSLGGVDAAVEVTRPDSPRADLRRLAALGVNTDSGTTGWFEHLAAVHQALLPSRPVFVSSALP